MPIAVGVARVSGAMRTGFERGRGVYVRPAEPARTELEALLEDTAAYAQETRKRILAELEERKAAKNFGAPSEGKIKWREGVEIREETDTEFYKRYRGLCQKIIGGSQERRWKK